MKGLTLHNVIGGLAATAVMLAGSVTPVAAHGVQDDIQRIAVVSAYAPEMSILKSEFDDTVVHSMNGVDFSTGKLQGRNVVLFLSGVKALLQAIPE